MRIIGLTGSIACGKSTVSAYLLSLGFPVVDGDVLSREIMVPGSPVLHSLHQAFGPDIFYEDGTLNRRRLGRIIFSDPAARKYLDDLMSPFLLEATRQRIDSIRCSGAAVCFLDMPLLFEKGYDRLCDTVWTVWLPENIQISRLMERDGYTREEAVSRIRSVLSSDEKASMANKVIDNSGSVTETQALVYALLSEELSFSDQMPRRHRSHSLYESSPETSLHQSSVISTPDAPQRMERPSSSGSAFKNRKAEWRLPFWLKCSMIAFSLILMLSVTSLLIMRAYLRDCTEQHIAEQESIDRHYPLLYRDLIEKYAEEYNLSPAYVSAIIMNESSFQPRAESGVGARGLMQLMPETAEWIAGKLKVNGYAFERMFDPESNIRFGCWYLNYLSRLYLGDPVAVTAAYHAGQGQVKTWLSDPALSENGYSLLYDSLPEGPTKIYVGKVIRDYGIYQEKYFSDHLLSPDSDGNDESVTSLRI